MPTQDKLLIFCSQVANIGEHLVSKKREERQIQLIFGPRLLPPELRTTGAKGFEGKAEVFATTLKELVRWFKDFHVDSIELWLEGGVKEGGITKLFISFEGKGGCKVTLKPK